MDVSSEDQIFDHENFKQSLKSVNGYTVELGFKNRQNKNQLDFKNQITNYRFFM